MALPVRPKMVADCHSPAQVMIRKISYTSSTSHHILGAVNTERTYRTRELLCKQEFGEALALIVLDLEEIIPGGSIIDDSISNFCLPRDLGVMLTLPTEHGWPHPSALSVQMSCLADSLAALPNSTLSQIFNQSPFLPLQSLRVVLKTSARHTKSIPFSTFRLVFQDLCKALKAPDIILQHCVYQHWKNMVLAGRPEETGNLRRRTGGTI